MLGLFLVREGSRKMSGCCEIGVREYFELETIHIMPLGVESREDVEV